MTSVEAEAEAGPSNLNPKISTIPVRLVSRTDAYAVPSSKFMIPSDWRRFQLSELINKVCGNEQAIPFDFIVNEELLRTSLGEWTKAKGLTEVILPFIFFKYYILTEIIAYLPRKVFLKSNMSKAFFLPNILILSKPKTGYQMSTFKKEGVLKLAYINQWSIIVN